jgi:hypothetical protein
VALLSGKVDNDNIVDAANKVVNSNIALLGWET